MNKLFYFALICVLRWQSINTAAKIVFANSSLNEMQIQQNISTIVMASRMSHK